MCGCGPFLCYLCETSARRELITSLQASSIHCHRRSQFDSITWKHQLSVAEARKTSPAWESWGQLPPFSMIPTLYISFSLSFQAFHVLQIRTRWFWSCYRDVLLRVKRPCKLIRELQIKPNKLKIPRPLKFVGMLSDRPMTLPCCPRKLPI